MPTSCGRATCCASKFLLYPPEFLAGKRVLEFQSDNGPMPSHTRTNFQEALGVDELHLDMMSSEEMAAAETIMQTIFADKEATEYLIAAIHAGDLTVQTAKPLLPPQVNSALKVVQKKEQVGSVIADIGKKKRL